MLTPRLSILAAMSVLLVSATAIDLTAELNAGWKMGLHPRQASQNLQTFASSLGGVRASAPDFNTAAGRSCDNQKNNCAEIANSGGPFEVGDCDRQNGE
ncbi:hypothetical protein jhhlp_003956 [Lomentospora prolificans]|uniref:Uncharacterized protein n=1 Tax=Lomentospora prolificans TaxID=41688 RepID=A0A2N3NAD1_9PEZI|nr:hypothetical protein jhhlp_003956 [Lomentospora prolificans]